MKMPINRRVKIILLVILAVVLVGFAVQYFVDFGSGSLEEGVVQKISQTSATISMAGDRLAKVEIDKNTKFYFITQVLDQNDRLGVGKFISEKEINIGEVKAGDWVYFETKNRWAPVLTSLRVRSGLLGRTSLLLSDLYDDSEKGFKSAPESSETNLEDTYYGLWLYKSIAGHQIETSEEVDLPGVLKKIRSYYVAPGYYAEKGDEPVFSTANALGVDAWFPEDLNQKIDLNWLKENSLENKNLKKEKNDPQHQLAIIRIYRSLAMPEKMQEVAPFYLNYYCNVFKASQTTSDEDYLDERYLQTILVADLSAVSNVSKSCWSDKNIEADNERLNKIQLSQLSKIKSVSQFYYLKSFYNLKSDVAGTFNKIKEFYGQDGFKENLNDSGPNMAGTFYGVTLMQHYTSQNLFKTF